MNAKIPDGMTAIEAIENYLGNNLQLLRDKLDLLVRQKDPSTLAMLADINEAWRISCFLLKEEKQIKHKET